MDGLLFLFLKEINSTFIQQECITLIKSDSKNGYFVRKDFYFCSIEIYIHQTILKKIMNPGFHKKY